uniref:Ubiquinol-cytochrome c reductase subunit 8 n=1 Tax=Cryptococcus bacillisporus CA1280 TaxID=1296109 RepID=A0A0D0VP38_CRYGA|nr:ubiquinol-cytochrome c reductase subunit 8 [Cryptococcus bacillisporus CA1280]
MRPTAPAHSGMPGRKLVGGVTWEDPGKRVSRLTVSLLTVNDPLPVCSVPTSSTAPSEPCTSFLTSPPLLFSSTASTTGLRTSTPTTTLSRVTLTTSSRKVLSSQDSTRGLLLSLWPIRRL